MVDDCTHPLYLEAWESCNLGEKPVLSVPPSPWFPAFFADSLSSAQPRNVGEPQGFISFHLFAIDTLSLGNLIPSHDYR